MKIGIDTVADKEHLPENFSLLKNFFLTILTIIFFLSGVVLYGMILNLRDVPLKVAILKSGKDSLDNVNILIERKSFTLYLYSDTTIIKKYRASFGKNLLDKKINNKDGATPVGIYSICEIISEHKYHRYLRINYPNLSDAVDAFRIGIITKKEFDVISDKIEKGECPSDKTQLGGDIGIHGIGRFNFFLKNLPFVFNWTNGSIALSNEHIDELYSIVSKGTKVVIK